MADDPARTSLGYLLVASATGVLGYFAKALADRFALPPSKVRLDDAQANQIMQQIYGKLLDDTQEERDKLKADLASQAANLTEERLKNYQLTKRVEKLEAELVKAKENEMRLLQTLAEKEGEIERLRRNGG